MKHNPKFTTRIGNVHVDAAIMNRRDWRRVKKEAVHLTAAQQMTYTKELDERKRTQTRAIKIEDAAYWKLKEKSKKD